MEMKREDGKRYVTELADLAAAAAVLAALLAAAVLTRVPPATRVAKVALGHHFRRRLLPRLHFRLVLALVALVLGLNAAALLFAAAHLVRITLGRYVIRKNIKIWKEENN